MFSPLQNLKIITFGACPKACLFLVFRDFGHARFIFNILCSLSNTCYMLSDNALAASLCVKVGWTSVHQIIMSVDFSLPIRF